MDGPASFVWDPAKASSNLAKHGIAFDEAVAVFLDADLADFDASREGDAEERRKAVGRIEGYVFTVVYTRRGTQIRLISARRANAMEVRAYGRR